MLTPTSLASTGLYLLSTLALACATTHTPTHPHPHRHTHTYIHTRTHARIRTRTRRVALASGVSYFTLHYMFAGVSGGEATPPGATCLCMHRVHKVWRLLRRTGVPSRLILVSLTPSIYNTRIRSRAMIPPDALARPRSPPNTHRTDAHPHMISVCGRCRAHEPRREPGADARQAHHGLPRPRLRR
jgi:hypothetical protein